MRSDFYNFYTLIGSVVLAVFLGLPALKMLFRKNHFQVDGRTVVITGGSQGMGLSLATLLAKRGANIVIVARNIKKLQSALETISACQIRDTQRFHYIAADVTKASENERILREVMIWNNGQAPDIVWANAGASIPTLFLETSLQTMREQMEINYWAATYLAHATLRAWLQPGAKVSGSDGLPKHFIMTSSSAAFVNVAGYNPYSPAKAALRSLADGLRSEINLYNGSRARSGKAAQPEVKIHCVFPGTILSPGLEHENKVKHEITKKLEDGDPVQTAEEVALVAVSELEKGHFLIATNWLGKLMRVSGLQGSPRNGWGVSDTLLSWVTAIAWLFIGPDMESKVYNWGKTNGITIPTQ